MKREGSTAQAGFFNARVLIAVLVCAAAACSLVSGTLLGFFSSEAPAKTSQRTLTFQERVAYQRAIEEVYWRHRIWPKENPGTKPVLEAVVSQRQIEQKVENYLRKCQALEDYWQRPITAEQLQAEMDRMAKNTKQPEVLRELFEALGNDPLVVAECLARPTLAERLVTNFSANDRDQLDPSRARAENEMPKLLAAASANYTLPTISDAAPNGCTDDTWTATSTINAPTARYWHTAVWTGTEMIVWGGENRTSFPNTGGRYNPSTDSWTATTTTNAPGGRPHHTAVWTGSEMIVWGGGADPNYFFDGGRYNPVTDTWAATSFFNPPIGRRDHTAVWTGNEMIVWGGFGSINHVYLNTGGRYNPVSNSWTATTITNAPTAREYHRAIWTGSDMIVWGGQDSSSYSNTGGKYNPGTDSWTATSIINVPSGRIHHTAAWTGSEMIVWGGYNNTFFDLSNGGRYNPNADSWIATSTTNAPAARDYHTVVWTGSEMIIWGGSYLNTGGRYAPATDTWIATSTTNAPSGRTYHTAVWTGSEMIVWGGAEVDAYNTGGRYCAQFAAPSPTPTATVTPTATQTPTATATPIATATPTPTSTPRPTATPRTEPTPRGRPTPPPRP